jgi:hypothetical protein
MHGSTDGSRPAIDVLVLATDHNPQQEAVRKTFGDDIADRVGPVWAFVTMGNSGTCSARPFNRVSTSSVVRC